MMPTSTVDLEADGFSPAQPIELAHHKPIPLGPLIVEPALRRIAHQDGREEFLEPRIMQVLVALIHARGDILSRDDLTHSCWGGRVVGDSSIDRVMSRLRRISEGIAAGVFRIETITKVGFRLVVQCEDEGKRLSSETPSKRQILTDRRRWLVSAGAAAFAASSVVYLGFSGARGSRDSLSLPAEAQQEFSRAMLLMYRGGESMIEAVAALEHVTALVPEYADGWGYLALALEGTRYWTAPAHADRITARSRAVAQRALALDPKNSAALTALAHAIPVYGDWLAAELALREIIKTDPEQIFARLLLSRVLDDVGRNREAVEIVQPIDADWAMLPRLQAETAIRLWRNGQTRESDRVINRALDTWPRNYAVWSPRFFLWMWSGRPDTALAFSRRTDARPISIPDWQFELNEKMAKALLSGAPAEIEQTMAANRDAARKGGGFAANGIQFAAQVGDLDEAFSMAEGYYFGRGIPVARNWLTGQQEQYMPGYRRLTGLLFDPSGAQMRKDLRFKKLVEEVGLTSYWRRSGTRADVFA